MTILKGEIYWADLNPTIGSEISKTRPVIVVSNDIGNKVAATITVVPITSQPGKIYPYEVLLKASETGLSTDSKAKANQIRTIDKARLQKRMGKLNDATLRALENAILIHLGIRK